MLSRLATSKLTSLWSSTPSSSMGVVLLSKRSTSSLFNAPEHPPRNQPPVIAEDPPERDNTNFPRRQRPIDMEPVRLGFLPESWFKFFYEKTGVTGPYMFIASVGTFAVSKEIWVLEHEFYTGLALVIIFWMMNRTIGPEFKQWMENSMVEREAELKAVRQDEIDRCLAAITEEEKSQMMASGYESLIQAKKENVELQLESAYRQRIKDAYEQIKKRLDYQLEVSNVMRRIEQKHMVDWIMSNVRKSITAKQEDEALKKCVQDLKALAK